MKKCVKKYANDLIKDMKSNRLMKDNIKTKRIEAVQKIIKLYEEGLLSPTEALVALTTV